MQHYFICINNKYKKQVNYGNELDAHQTLLYICIHIFHTTTCKYMSVRI